jgi:hypothetical protein
MTTSNHRSPNSYTEAELRDMLRTERLALTRRVITLKREVRERVAEIEVIEARLANIAASEDCLQQEQQ